MSTWGKKKKVTTWRKKRAESFNITTLETIKLIQRNFSNCRRTCTLCPHKFFSVKSAHLAMMLWIKFRDYAPRTTHDQNQPILQ